MVPLHNECMLVQVHVHVHIINCSEYRTMLVVFMLSLESTHMHKFVHARRYTCISFRHAHLSVIYVVPFYSEVKLFIKVQMIKLLCIYLYCTVLCRIIHVERLAFSSGTMYPHNMY